LIFSANRIIYLNDNMNYFESQCIFTKWMTIFLNITRTMVERDRQNQIRSNSPFSRFDFVKKRYHIRYGIFGIAYILN